MDYKNSIFKIEWHEQYPAIFIIIYNYNFDYNVP